MKTQINSNITDTVNIYTSPNGLTVYLGQTDQEIKMSIDHASKVAVEILTHVEKLAKLYL